MKNHYYIKHVLIISILLAFASTKALLADEVAAAIEGTSTSDESSQPEGSFLDTPETEKDATTADSIPAQQDFFPGLTRVLQSTAIVIILIVGTVFFLKKKFGVAKAGGKKYMRVIESIPIGAKRCLLLVKIPGKLLVIGMANDNINPLSEITDKEVVDAVSPSSGNNDFMGFMKKVYSEKRQVQAGVSENNQQKEDYK